MEEIKGRDLQGFDPKELAELFKAYGIKCEPLRNSILIENAEEAKKIIKELKKAKESKQ